MKKLTILISGLALASCGGGGGGGQPSERVRVTPNEGYLSATLEAVASNEEVTDMVSEIAICTENCESPRQDAVRVSTKEINGKKFNIYDLNDVDFVFAEEGFGGKLQFKVDPTTKQIVSIIFDEDEENPLVRDTTDNKFRGIIENDDAALTYSSVAKREELGLRYSDFGKFEVEADHIGADGKLVGVFIGGYDVKKIDPNTVHTAMTFNGRAVGGVEAVRAGQGSGKSLILDTSNNAKESDKIATLTFDNGTSTLNAKFDNWYDVKHVKSNMDEYVEFSNFTNTRDDAADFRMISNAGDDAFALRNHPHTEYEEDVPQEDCKSLESDIRYYGDNGTPREAVGLVQIVDRGTENANYDERGENFNENQVRMNLGFGGTISNQ